MHHLAMHFGISVGCVPHTIHKLLPYHTYLLGSINTFVAIPWPTGGD